MSETYEKAVTCGCGARYTTQAITLMGQEIYGKLCPTCILARNAEAEAEQRNTAALERQRAWEAVCPPSYRDTNPQDPRLNATALRLSAAWQPSGARGLGFTGETGSGKTRCLFLALRRAFEAGKSIAFVSHNHFSRLAQDSFMGEKVDDARNRLKLFHRCGVLLIDDLGKAPKTERADAEMEELIECRTNSGLPILWSANASGEWLIKRFGEDRGPALVRRLAEFCDCHAL